MARRSIFDRAREFIAGTSRRVREAIENIVESFNEVSEEQELIDRIEAAAAAENEELPVSEELPSDSIDTGSDIIGISDESYPPEGDDEDDDPNEDFESEFEFEIGDFNSYDADELRRIVASFEEAVNYARDISLPAEDISIIQDGRTGLFRVRVDYEVVVS